MESYQHFEGLGHAVKGRDLLAGGSMARRQGGWASDSVRIWGVGSRGRRLDK